MNTIIRHGHSRRGAITKTYRAWRYMIQRCERPKNPVYKYYGGRGITICPEWHRFDNFLADMGCAPVGRSLDRIDNNGPYCKANCRWATCREQSANTRRNRYITFNGETRCLAEWARVLKVNVNTFWSRVRKKGGENAIRASIM